MNTDPTKEMERKTTPLNRPSQPTFPPTGALHLAAMHSPSALKAAYAFHSHALDSVWAEGLTPLACACKAGHWECAQLLLSWGARVDGVDWFGRTPLHHAAQSGASRTLQQLLRQPEADGRIRDSFGVTPLMLAAFAGSEAGADSLRVLLNAGVPLEAQDDEGNHALHYAAAYGGPCCLDCLLEAGADPHRVNHAQRTALHTALFSGWRALGSPHRLHPLIQRMTSIQPLDLAGYDPLALLYHQAYVSTHRPTGARPLTDSEQCLLYEYTLLFLESGYDPNRPSAPGGLCLLHLLAVYGTLFHPEDWKTLIGYTVQRGANPNQTDDWGCPAFARLHFLHPEQSLLFLSFLCTAGADLQQTDRQSSNLIHWLSSPAPLGYGGTLFPEPPLPPHLLTPLLLLGVNPSASNTLGLTGYTLLQRSPYSESPELQAWLEHYQLQTVLPLPPRSTPSIRTASTL